MAVQLKAIDQRVIVITGASSGIGLCTALLAAERGARLVLAARSGDTLQAIVDEITGAGGEAIAVVTDEQDIPAQAPEGTLFHHGVTGQVYGPGKGVEREMNSLAHPPQALLLTRRDWVPNHPWFPVLIYRDVPGIAAAQDSATALEALFMDNGWPPRWRSAIYDYHHYHSTAHEVLGVARGAATLELGGPGGEELDVRRGDVIVLPAGTGHRQQRADDDFLVVGAYPPEQQWDICRSAPTQAMLERIEHLPFPASDPVSGANGPLTQQWSRTLPSAR